MAKHVTPAACDFEQQPAGHLPKARMINLSGKKDSDGAKLDRATLRSTQLYRLAITEEIQLTQDEIDRVSPDYLFVLAITNKLRLSQRDKDRLKPLHVAHLATAGTIDLSQEDKDRLPKELLFKLFVESFVTLSDHEILCFTAEQLEHLKELGTVYSESLVAR
jgi:hypothetical protein